MSIAIVGYGYRQPGGLTTDESIDEFFRSRGTVRVPVGDRYGKKAAPVQNKWMAEGMNNNELASPFEGLILHNEEIFFDYTHFGIGKIEAGLMDPQAKMALQCSWEAIERRGGDLKRFHNESIGVYMGTQVGSGAMWKAKYGPSQFDMTGFSLAMCANRISFHLNLTGPSFSCNTACSSGATATHLASKALGSGECAEALAGSSSYLGNILQSIAFNKLRVMSPTGRCHSFDSRANGYLRSEGVTIFVLKGAESARRDGDTVHMVILATAIACAGAEPDAAFFAQGRTITKPVSSSQAALMARTLESAGRSPSDVEYLEAHSTGTPVGDSVEGTAIASVYGDRDGKLRLASLRSNIGHQEASSFSSSLLKVLLMCRNRTFYPISSNYKSLNTEVPFDNVDTLCVQTEVEAFPPYTRRSVITVNSFGFGGSYGNCVVEEEAFIRDMTPASGEEEGFPSEAYCSIPLSAKSVPALREMAKTYATWKLTGAYDNPMGILASNLWNRRSRLPVRKAFVARTSEELVDELTKFGEQDAGDDVRRTNDDRDPIVVFSGQGSQWAGMGSALYDQGGVFKRTVDEIDSHWMELCGETLSGRAFNEDIGDAINEPENAQSCTFLVQAALYATLRSRGMTPACVLGHSAGESMAGYASGAYSLREACHLVYHRASLQQQLSGSGRMLVVLGIEYVELMELLKGDDFSSLGLELACRNSPTNTVITSTAEAIAKAKELLEERSLNCKLIRGTTAFHSRQMEPIKDALYEAYSCLDTRSPQIPMISTVAGDRVTSLDTDYWWSNVRQPVLFTDAISAAVGAFPDAPIVEISPHPTLISPARECVPSCVYLTTLDRKAEQARSLEAAVGQMFEHGVRFARTPLARGVCIAHRLPTYPFVKEVCLDKNVDLYFPHKVHPRTAGPLLGILEDAVDRRYTTTLSLDNYKYMDGHKINGVVLFPAAGYLECLFEAFQGEPICVENMDILMACEVVEASKAQKILETAIFPMGKSGTHFRFKITSRSFRESETLHATGVLRMLEEEEVAANMDRLTPERIESFDVQTFSSTENIYSSLETKIDKYFEYNGLFKIMQEVNVSLERQELLTRLELDEFDSWEEAGYIFHPAHLDGVLQTFCVIALMQQTTNYRGVPTGIHNLRFYKKPSGKKLFVHFRAPERLEGTPRKHGILSMSLGPTDSGGVSVYDGQTLELIASIDTYVSTQSIASYMKDNPQMKLVWQPKLMEDVHAGLEGANLVADLKALLAARTRGRLLNIGEIVASFENQTDEGADDDAPKESGDDEVPSIASLMEGIADELRSEDIRYSFLCEEIDPLIAAFDATGPLHGEITARFHKLDAGAIGKFSGAFDVLVCSAKPSMPVLSLVTPRGYIVDLGRSGTPGEGWEEISLPTNDGGYTVHRKGPTMATYRPIEDETMHTETEEAAGGEKASPVEPQEGTDDSRKRIIVGENGYADIFRDDSGLRNAFENYPDSIYFHLASLDDTVASDGAESHAAAWSLVDWFTDNLPEIKAPSTILVVTRNAIAYTSGGAEGPVDPRMRALWGSFRTIKEEYSDYRFVIVDIGSAADVPKLGQVLELGEDELVVRGDEIFCPRFRRETSKYLDSQPDGHGYRLTVNGSGSLDDLKFQLFERHAPPPGCVEVKIKAAALNFRDIMVSLSRLPFMSYERSGLGKTVGMECAGIVTRVGPGVKNFRAGDEVIGIGPALIADFAVLPETKLMRKPCDMSFERACSYPSVYITAFYALVEHAKLRRGQRILIHSALGGVGIAAMNICHRLGALVYATAGTDEKRQKLREMGCAGVFDSHSLSWYGALMTATDKTGVHVVLNSLAGEHLDLCLKALCAGGTHCEIGKMDVFEDRPLHMMVFRKNLKLAVIDIDRLGLDDPELLHDLFTRSAEFYSAGEHFEMPVQTFPYAEYDKAMRFMMKGQHTGKIVLTPPDTAGGSRALLPVPVIDTRKLFSKWPKTVAMTGAMGGIGVRMFAYLADNGVENFLLLDRDPDLRRDRSWMLRHSSLSYYHRSNQTKLNALNIRTTFVDLTDAAMVARALSPDSLRESGLPELGAVVHLAGVNDDKFLINVTEASMKYVFDSKVLGAINLHDATKDRRSVEHFIVFSSIVSVLGNATQATYSAANSFLDGLVESRRAAGLPALSYNMAAVMDAGGMASDDVNVLKGMIASGVRPIACSEALNSLDIALRDASSSHIISFAATRFKPSLRDSRRIGHMVPTKEAFTLSKSSSELDHESVVARLAAKVCEVCDTETVDVEQPLSDLGLNSVSMVELANFIQYEYEVEISPMKLMTGSCLGDVADTILDTILNNSAANETDDAQVSRERLSSKVGEDLEKYLDGLPKWCRQDFDSVRYRTASKNMRRSTRLQTYRSSEKKNAFVTGATGFLGSFLVADLFDRDDVDTIYCLVRPSGGVGVADRLREGMQKTGVWDERHLTSNRLVAVEGDMEKPHFGLHRATWEELSLCVDHVYHFAADLNLFKAYDDLRAVNTRSMMDLIDFSASGCKKDLHYASTLGVFPQYIASFRGRFRSTAIDLCGRPDVEDMKDVYKRQLGYPWSKLLAELMIEEARNTINLSAFIYRIPLTYYASRTGFVKEDDFAIKLVMNACITGYSPLPEGSMLGDQAQECGSSVTKLVTDLSLDGRRSHWVYHVLPGAISHNSESTAEAKAKQLSNRALYMELQELSGLFSTVTGGGNGIKSVPYEEFRMRCYSQSEDSPLFGLWGILDYYGATFWFNDDDNDGGDSEASDSQGEPESKDYPFHYKLIDVSAVEDDLPYRFKLGDNLETAYKNVSWVSRNESSYKAALTGYLQKSRVPTDARLAAIRKACASVDVSYEDVMPPTVERNFRSLIDAVESPSRKSDTSLMEHFDFWATQTERVYNRIQLYRTLRIYPQIRAPAITRPIFIVGLNRTGTTFLHRLFHQTGTVDCVTMRDQLFVPDPKALMTATPDALRQVSEARVGKIFKYQQYGQSVVSHMVSGSESAIGCVPEEEVEPMSRSFSSAFDFVQYDVPDALESAEANPDGLHLLYEEHKDWVKYMTHVRRMMSGKEVQRWLFKMPFHMRYLPSLFKTYPDAVVVHTHRPLEKVMPSWCKIVEDAREMHINKSRINKEAIGAQQLQFTTESLERVRAFRADNPELESQILDLHFDNIIADPIGAVRKIAEHAGITLTPEHEANVSRYLDGYQNQFTSASAVKNRGTLQEYGLSHLESS